MKILIVSERFHPSVGGVETVTYLLGRYLVRAGHSVSVVTRQPCQEPTAYEFMVTRRPGPVALLKQYASADAVILQGQSLRLGWPILGLRSPALMVHHMRPATGETRARRCLRSRLSAKARHAAVSRALAAQLPWHVENILPNPYDPEVFRLDQERARDRDVIFVGRLVPEKGAHVLLQALAILHQAGVPVTATLVGEGPEKARLEQLARRIAPSDCVRFAGQLIGPPLAQLLNRHRLMVVPSIGHEPFGLVAIEAIACGCVPIGSNIGGLPEAIGPCGCTFPVGDAPALAARIQQLIGPGNRLRPFQANAERHLANHHPRAVARGYLERLN